MGFPRARVTVPALALALVMACSSYSDAPGGTSMVDAGADAPATEPTTPDEAGAPKPTTIYVSAAGDDSRAGSDRAQPMKTIALALGRAKELGASELQVCAGVYDESATLDAPISIRGGYDCTTWTRPAGFGYPAFAGGASATRLTRSGDSTDAVTLVVRGATITHSTELEGLAIEGPQHGTRGIALRVVGQAAPWIHDVTVTGGQTAATSTGLGAVGIQLDEGAAPEIAHASISGGSGSATNGGTVTAYGSIAVHIIEASPQLHHSTLTASTSDTSAAGVFISGTSKLTGKNALSHLNISTIGSSTIFAAVGSTGKNAEIEVDNSDIDGAVTKCVDQVQPCLNAGLSITDAASVVLTANRIFGGEIATDQTRLATVTGALIQKTDSVTVIDNVIYSGNDSARAFVGAAGLAFTQTKMSRVVHNTIFAAPNKQSIAIVLADNAKASSIDANILGSSGQAVALQILCTATVATLAVNAFVGFDTEIASVATTNNCTEVRPKNLNQLGVQVPVAKDNIRIGPPTGCQEAGNACIAPPGCTSIATCPGSFIDNWTTPMRNGFFGGSWKLTTNAPCSLAKAVSIAPDALSDFTGAGRTPPTSLGAFEAKTCLL